MKNLFKVLLASILVVSMCITSVAFAAGELNLCGSYADVAEAGSVLSYSDGRFAGEDSEYSADNVSSGFEYVQINGGVINAVETANTLTYEKGVGGRSADDRSAKLNAYGKNAILAIAQLNDQGKETTNYFPLASDAVLVVEVDFLKTAATQSQISFQTGNTYRAGNTLFIKPDGTIQGRTFTELSSSAQNVLYTLEGAKWNLNEWHRIKMVYDRKIRTVNVFFDGKQAASYQILDNISGYGLTNVKITAEGGKADAPSSMYVDDVEVYVANSLESAMSTDKTVAADLTSKSANCVIDNTNNAISYTPDSAVVSLNEFTSALNGNVAGVMRNGALITSGNVIDGDKVVALSEDERTFRYYTVTIEDAPFISYSKGSFAGEDSDFVTDTVSSGFEYVQINGGVMNAVETPNTLTYEKGVGGKASDDRSAKLNAYGKNAILAAALLNDEGKETTDFYPLESDDVIVMEANILKTAATQSQVGFQTGNSYKYGTTLFIKGTGAIQGRSYSDGTNTGTAVLTDFDATWSLNEWLRIKLVYDRSTKTVYAFIDGKQVASYPVHDNTTKNGITNVKFTAEGGSADAPSSMYVDDVEVYIASSLEAAMNSENAVVADINANSDKAVVDNTNDTITFTSSEAPVLADDVLAALSGNIAGVVRNGKLIDGEEIKNDDKIVVVSNDGRTYRYYTISINYELKNLMEGAELVYASIQSGNKIDGVATIAENMFDNDKSTCFQTWTGTATAEFIVDLGSVKNFNQIVFTQPESVVGGKIAISVDVSCDNVTYVPVMNSAIACSDLVTTLNIPEVNAKYVKIAWSKYESNKTAAYAEIELFKVEKSENICKNAMIIDGSEMSITANSSAGYYGWLDDNDATYYLSGNIGDKTATYILDLGQIKNFNSLRLAMGNNSYYMGSCDVKVSCSDDNVTYRDVVSYTGVVPKDIKEDTLGNTMTARFVKLEFTNLVHKDRTARLHLADFGLFYDGTEADPVDTSYVCYLAKNEDGTKFNVYTDVSVAESDYFECVLIAATYSDEKTLIDAVVLDDNFSVEAGSKVFEAYDFDVSEGTKIAKVFLWNGFDSVAPAYEAVEYVEE